MLSASAPVHESTRRTVRRTIGRAGTALVALVVVLFLVGCGSSSDDGYVIAFKVTEDRAGFLESTEPLADWIAEETGRPAEILTVQDDGAQITALQTGQADAAYMSGGPAWIAWSRFGLEAIAAESDEDGETHYVAGLWVRSDSEIEEIADLRGRPSCHTGELAGTGMLVPIGYLIGEGHIDRDSLAGDDISAVQEARESFFGQARIGGGYLGAFRCLATGEGEVATGRHTAWDDFCSGSDRETWCEARETFRWLPSPDGPDHAVEEIGGLAEVPSHPVMVSDELDGEAREDLLEALLALNGSGDGEAILSEVLEAGGIVEVNTADHLERYGQILANVPGIEEHFGGEGE